VWPIWLFLYAVFFYLTSSSQYMCFHSPRFCLPIVLFQCREENDWTTAMVEAAVHAVSCAGRFSNLPHHFYSTISFCGPSSPCSVFVQCFSCFTHFSWLQTPRIMKVTHITNIRFLKRIGIYFYLIMYVYSRAFKSSLFCFQSSFYGSASILYNFKYLSWTLIKVCVNHTINTNNCLQFYFPNLSCYFDFLYLNLHIYHVAQFQWYKFCGFYGDDFSSCCLLVGCDTM
jgi:hypothetical protein